MSQWNDDFCAGTVRIENGGTVVKLYAKSGTTSSTSLNGKKARNAYFSGGYVVVEFENGDRRRFDRYWGSSSC